MWDQVGDVLTVVGTIIFIILIFVGAYFATKLMGRRASFRQQSGNGEMKVLSQLALGQDRALVIVRTAGQVLLLGVAPQGITYLKELDPAAFPEEPPDEGGGQPASSPFSTALQDALKNWGIGPGKNKKEGKGP